MLRQETLAKKSAVEHSKYLNGFIIKTSFDEILIN